MSDSTLQFILMCIVIVLFIFSCFIAIRGFRSSTSWFCMVFSISVFSQALFAFPAAFIGNSDYTWMIGREVSTTYLQVVVLSMISLWASHLLTRKKISFWVNKKLKIPQLKIQDKNIENIAYFFSLGGSIIAIFAANMGIYGYFVEREFLQNPPIWLDLFRKSLSLFVVFYFILFISIYRRSGSLNVRHYLLISLWIMVGFLSAFKLQVIQPIIILFVTAWMTKRLTIIHHLALGFSIILAYSVVEPMREIAVNSYYSVTPYDAFAKSLTENNGADIDHIISRLISRLDYSSTAIQVLTADRFGQISQYKDRIINTYKLIPFLAFIPRAFWPEKPLQDLGRVLYNDLYGSDISAITPSGAIASYLIGGYIMVIFQSTLFGMFLTFSGSVLLKYHIYPMRYLPILILAISISMGDTYFSYYLIKVLRVLLFTYLCYFVLKIFHKVSLNYY
ncbi:MAG TPA: hypothetical protein PKY50_13960 [Candidatus Competibacter sp.]|nr:hypothetical protein [Candidatus Competibacter sp.]